MQVPLMGIKTMVTPTQTLPRVDYDAKALYTTFGADEVIEQLKISLKSLSSKEKAKRIIHEVQQELVKAAWKDKMNRLTRDMTRACLPTADKDEIKNGVMRELEDILAYIQILGGLNEKEAEKLKIKHDFQRAFQFLIQLMRSVHKWQDFPNLREPRRQFLSLCYCTIAELLNVNCVYCENAELLNKCLSWVLEQDLNGNMADHLIPPLKKYYLEYVLESFHSRLMLYQLVPALKASMELDRDISAEVDQLPEDPNGRKFGILCNKIFEEKFREQAIKCATKCEDVDVAVRAMKMYRNKDIANQYFLILSGQLSKWVNAFLRLGNIKEKEIKDIYDQLRKLTLPLSSKDKESVFGIVRGTELEHAIRATIKRTKIDLQNDPDPMAADILLMLGNQ